MCLCSKGRDRVSQLNVSRQLHPAIRQCVSVDAPPADHLSDLEDTVRLERVNGVPSPVTRTVQVLPP